MILYIKGLRSKIMLAWLCVAIHHLLLSTGYQLSYPTRKRTSVASATAASIRQPTHSYHPASVQEVCSSFTLTAWSSGSRPNSSQVRRCLPRRIQYHLWLFYLGYLVIMVDVLWYLVALPGSVPPDVKRCEVCTGELTLHPDTLDLDDYCRRLREQHQVKWGWIT